MNKYLVTTLASVIIAAPAAAQDAASVFTGGQSTFSVTPYAGYMFFGNLAEPTGNTSITNDDSWMVGAQAKVRMTSRWAVVGNAGYSKTAFQTVTTTGSTTTTQNSGDIGYWLADAGLQYQLPFVWRNGSVAPFVQGGVGAVRYTAEADDLGSDNTTNVQFNGGVGIDVNVGAVGLQFMLKDYVTSLDWQNLRGIDYGDIATGDADRSRIAHNLALTAGIRLNF